jgi:hypothetical protein
VVVLGCVFGALGEGVGAGSTLRGVIDVVGAGVCVVGVMVPVALAAIATVGESTRAARRSAARERYATDLADKTHALSRESKRKQAA